MRIPHIYCSTPIEIQAPVTLDKAKSHHLINVLRLQPEHPVTLFCGDSKSYQGRIAEVGRDSVTVIASEALATQQESPLDITLYQSLCKGEKMDWVIQKATELGVNKIVPTITERCDMRIPAQKIEKKLAHWQGIIISAAQQAKRQTLTSIEAPITLGAMLEQKPEHLLVMAPTQGKPLSSIQPKPPSCQILIGPEGGLSDTEYQRLDQNNAIRVQMGPRVLRTETAAITAVSLCQGLWGDLQTNQH